MVTVKYDDLSTAFDFVSFCRSNGASGARVAGYGATYWISETNPIEKDECPDDLETSDRYTEIPHKTELDLGNNLALRFVEGGCQAGTRTSRPSSGAAAHTRVSRSFSERKAVLRSGAHSRRSRPSERCGSGAKRIRSTWPRTAVNNRPNLARSRRRLVQS